MRHRRRLINLVVLCILAFAMSGCGKPKYTLSVDVTPTGAGSVTLSSGPVCPEGTEVTLIPVANSGWVFDHWEGPDAGDVTGVGGQWRIVMDGDKTLTAAFKSASSTLTVSLSTDVTSGTAPLEIAFTATPGGTDETGLTYDWNFGDGNTLTGSGPTQTHTYQNDGTFTATVVVHAPSNATASDEIEIVVSMPGNGSPDAVNDSVTVNEDETVLIDVLSNDSDPNGDTLTIESFAQGSHGTVVKEGSSLRYTPAANYHGTDSFTYTVSDGKGATDLATVNVTVTSVNDTPEAANDSLTLNEDANILIDVAANDSDADGDTLSITAFTQGAHGTVLKEGNSLRYTPTAHYYGSDSFTYSVSDGHGGTATASVNITVSSVNDAPVAQNDNAEVNEDETTLIDVVANDSDVEGDALLISSVTQGSHGMVSKEGNSIRYTPDAGYHGTDSFTYTVSDGHGGLSTALVNVTVIDMNPVLLSMDIVEADGSTDEIPFTVTRAGNYQIQTSYYLSPDCDTVLYLFDGSMTPIATNDDYVDLYSCLIMWLEPGTYYVAVEEIYLQQLYCHLEIKGI